MRESWQSKLDTISARLYDLFGKVASQLVRGGIENVIIGVDYHFLDWRNSKSQCASQFLD